MSLNYFDYDLIPLHMMENIKAYVAKKQKLGGFLHAVFSNDLFRAVGAADAVNLPLIPMYVNYAWNECPSGCHGSMALVENWMEKK